MHIYSNRYWILAVCLPFTAMLCSTKRGNVRHCCAIFTSLLMLSMLFYTLLFIVLATNIVRCTTISIVVICMMVVFQRNIMITIK